MARIDNAITFGSGFNISATAPIDSRMLVEYENDLISSTTWPADKAPVYDGMTVTVKATGDIWVLLDKTKYTDKTTGEGWVKSGGDIDIDVTPDEVYEFLTNTVLYLSNGDSVMLTALTSEDIAQYKTSLVKVQIGDNVTDIDNQMFSGCTGLTSVLISDSVTSIGNGAFSGCAGLSKINIPNSVTTIGYQAFLSCTSLPVIGDIRYADTYLAEALDKSLSTYVINDGTRWIGDYAFGDCTGLTSIEIPNSVTSIGNFAFNYCSSLTSVTIPNSVTSIGNYAFLNCSSLTSIEIPNSVTSIGGSAFLGCTGLTSINVASDNSNYCSVDGVLFNKDKTTIIQYPGGKQGAYTIPNSVTSIGNNAFYGCYGLTSVTIGNSVTSIGERAFRYCTRLTSLTIPNSVTSIGNDAFYNVPHIEYYGAATGAPWGALSMN